MVLVCGVGGWVDRAAEATQATKEEEEEEEEAVDRAGPLDEKGRLFKVIEKQNEGLKQSPVAG